MTWWINFLAWRQRIRSLACFANNFIHPCWLGPRLCQYLAEKCLELDPQANLPRWWPPDLHADAGQETHQRICQFLLAESCSIFLNQICWIFDDESMLIMVCYFKRICEINPAKDRVTWPNLLHRHPSTLVSFQEWLVASTTRVAPNSGPAPKSLLTSEFRLVLDLVKWDGDRGGYFVDLWPGRGRSWITGLAGISELGPNSEPCDVETTDHSRILASALVCRWRRSGHVTRSSAWLIPHIF